MPQGGGFDGAGRLPLCNAARKMPYRVDLSRDLSPLPIWAIKRLEGSEKHSLEFPLRSAKVK